MKRISKSQLDTIVKRPGRYFLGGVKPWICGGAALRALLARIKFLS